MENKTLKIILQEYEKKRYDAEQKSKLKKQKLYANHNILENIEKKINIYSIQKINLILNSSDAFQDEIKNIDNKILELKKEKEKILNSLSIPKDYFLPQYECKICNDTGYIKENNITKMCPCLKQKIFNLEYNKSNIGNIEKENFSTFRLDLYSDTVDSNFNISPRENIKIIKSIAEKFIINFDNPDEKNLLFKVNTGLGKTFLCNCIANELLKKNKTVLYQTAPIMIDAIMDYRFGKNNVDNNLLEHLLNVDLLIIDDLGTEAINNMKLTELFTILNSRILNQNHKITKTIISTNLNLNNIFSIYNERIGSRIVGYYNICRCIGDDIRFKH